MWVGLNFGVLFSIGLFHFRSNWKCFRLEEIRKNFNEWFDKNVQLSITQTFFERTQVWVRK